MTVSLPLSELDDLVAAVLAHPGLHNKSAIGLVTDVLGKTDWVSGPGDDAAAVDALGGKVVACGEALFPPFVMSVTVRVRFPAVTSVTPFVKVCTPLSAAVNV